MRPPLTPYARASTLSRRGLVLGGVAALSGCSLRLEKDAPLPGPKATTPSDVAPLRTLRTRLNELEASTSRSSQHPTQARALAAKHREQLRHVEATLKGLGSPVTSTAAPAPTNVSPDWITAENRWTSPAQLRLLASISRDSRPMAICAAATGLTSTEALGAAASWNSDATFPGNGSNQALESVEVAIDALEWCAAQTPAQDRGSVPAALSWLYGVRAMTQAAQTPSSTASPAPIRRYENPNAAKKIAVTALQNLLPACAIAAQSATTVAHVEGVLLTWSKAIRELERQGAPDNKAFPGLATKN